MKKKRLDVLLFEKGMVPSRERAKAIIMSGIVYVNNQKADKAGMSIPEDAEVEIRGKTNSFVSRGGLKIEKALNYFQIDPKDLCVMAHAKFIRLTSDMVSSHGNCARIRAWFAWNEPIFAR